MDPGMGRIFMVLGFLLLLGMCSGGGGGGGRGGFIDHHRTDRSASDMGDK
jgi:hypothetical protein